MRSWLITFDHPFLINQSDRISNLIPKKKSQFNSWHKVIKITKTLRNFHHRLRTEPRKNRQKLPDKEEKQC